MLFTQLNLNENITKAIEQCGYTTPTPIQAKSIPVILEGKDIVASAQTGTGKTAAFVLPSLNLISNQPRSNVTSVLVLTPTRELAKQIADATLLYGKYLQLNVVNLVGGMPYPQQVRELKRGANIIIATPGRLLDHIEQRRVDLSQLQILILDEADRMLDMGFIDDVEMIAKLTPKKRQTLLFSATVDKKLTRVVQHLLRDPVRIDLSEERLTVPNIEQRLYRAKNLQHKTRILKQLLADESIFKAIIFTATKAHADKLADQLFEEGHSTAALHGDLRQNVRNRTVDQLRRGKIQYLVATDVAARGIDISDITHVINFDLPRSSEDYVHRIGRTGRAGKNGIAISFALPTESRQVQFIERYIGQRLPIVHHDDSAADHSDRSEARPARRTSAEREDSRDSRPPRRTSSDRDDRAPRRSFADRDEARTPRRSTDEARAPRRPFGDRDETTRAPKRSFGDRDEARTPRRSTDEARAPRRPFGDRDEARAPKRSFGDRDESRTPRRSTDEARAPRRPFGDRDEARAPKRSFGNRDESRTPRSSYAGRDESPRAAKRPSFGDRDESTGPKRAPRGDREFSKSSTDDRSGPKKRFQRDDKPNVWRSDKPSFPKKRAHSNDDDSAATGNARPGPKISYRNDGDDAAPKRKRTFSNDETREPKRDDNRKFFGKSKKKTFGTTKTEGGEGRGGFAGKKSFAGKGKPKKSFSANAKKRKTD